MTANTGITTSDILKAADWSSETVFTKFYYKPLRSELGLQTTTVDTWDWAFWNTLQNGSAHAVGTKYSGLYEEGEVDHIYYILSITDTINSVQWSCTLAYSHPTIEHSSYFFPSTYLTKQLTLHMVSIYRWLKNLLVDTKCICHAQQHSHPNMLHTLLMPPQLVYHICRPIAVKL